LKHYRKQSEGDVLLLDELRAGNVEEKLKDAYDRLSDDGVLYVCDSAVRWFDEPSPTVRVVRRVTLIRFLERNGFKPIRVFVDGNRVYGYARKQ